MRRLFVLAPAVSCALLALTAVSAEPGELSGRITLVGPASGVTPAVDAVVWLPGVRAVGARPPSRAGITQHEKRFDPHVLAVAKGTIVAFPNLDRIYHNVFSLTPGSEFDLGLYRGGSSREVKLETPGLVRVYCNIHSQMAAYVMVIDGTAFAVTDAAGRYRIPGVPAGRHVVRVWHERGGGKEAPLEVAAGEPATFDAKLDASGYREQPHKNKQGRDYPPAGSDVDRY